MPPRKPRIQVNKAWFFLFEIIGFGLSVYLFLVSASIINIPCPRNSIFACTGVVRGTFGHIGPFSVAAMGIFYFTAHLMLTAGLRERMAQALKAVLVVSGLFFIAWLRALELIYIKEICPWCWGVALVTLIHAGLTYGLVAPPLPKLRPGGIVGLVIGGFIVVIGLVAVVELSLGIGKKMEAQRASGGDLDPVEVSSVPVAAPKTKTPKPKKTPEPTPRPTPKPTPQPTPTDPSVNISEIPPTPSITPTPSPTPAPTPSTTPELTFDPEPQIADSEEVRILRARGWRHAGSGASIVKAVKVQPPVLMLAYDPHCSDCHRLITQVLNSDRMNGLPVTRVAIQESMLSGQLNDMVKALPTMILFGEDGTELMRQVGSRISDKELEAKIRKALGQ